MTTARQEALHAYGALLARYLTERTGTSLQEVAAARRRCVAEGLTEEDLRPEVVAGSVTRALDGQKNSYPD